VLDMQVKFVAGRKEVVVAVVWGNCKISKKSVSVSIKKSEFGVFCILSCFLLRVVNGYKKIKY